jgi:hypothetical protein
VLHLNFQPLICFLSISIILFFFQGVVGEWERPISIYRAAFSFVGQVRPHLPDCVGGRVWYGQDAPHGAVYVPIYASQTSIAHSFADGVGVQSRLSRKSSWWAFNFVNNWSYKQFSLMRRDVEAKRDALEKELFANAHAEETAVLADYRAAAAAAAATAGDAVARAAAAAAAARLQRFSVAAAAHVVDEWWSLADLLVGKYSDGYITTGEGATESIQPGYTPQWLQTTRFPYAAWTHPPLHATQVGSVTHVMSHLSIRFIQLMPLIT